MLRYYLYRAFFKRRFARAQAYEVVLSLTNMLWMVRRELEDERSSLKSKQEYRKELDEKLHKAEAKLKGSGIDNPVEYLKKDPSVDDEKYYEVLPLAIEVNRIQEKIDELSLNMDSLQNDIESLEIAKQKVECVLIDLSGLLQEDRIRRTSDIVDLFETSDAKNLLNHESLNIADCGIYAYLGPAAR